MKTLGIDYGRSKIGLAIGEAGIAEPYKVLHVKNFSDAIQKTVEAIIKEAPEKIVVGVSEGVMGAESEEFSQIIKTKFNIPIHTFDETLSSKDAQAMSRAAGVRRKKRRLMEDAYAASIMLQAYLDANK